MFFKIGVPKNFLVFTGKHLCWSLFFKKLHVWRPAKRLRHRCFPVNVAKCLFNNTFFVEHLRWLKWWNSTKIFGNLFSYMLTSYVLLKQNKISLIYWNVLLWIFSNWCVKLTFSSRLSGLKRFHAKISSQQYKRRIWSWGDETFYMYSQEVIYEEFITLPGSRQNETESFIPKAENCLWSCFSFTKHN